MTEHSAPARPGLLGLLREALTQSGRYRTRATVWTAAALWLIMGGLSWLYFVAGAITDLLLPPLLANADQVGGGGAALTAGQSTRMAIGFALIAVMVLLFARLVGGISWAALGIQRRDGRRLIVGGAAGVAVLYFTAMIAVAALDSLLPGAADRIYPGSGTSGAQLLVTDITSSTFGGAIWEELTLLAIPIALFAALVPANRFSRAGQVASWAGLTAVLVAMRCAIHLYYGWPTAVTVALWAAAAIVLFQLSGTVWPLIIAHALYDAAAFAQTRVPVADPVITWLLWGVAAGGIVLLVATAFWYRDRLRAARRLPALASGKG